MGDSKALLADEELRLVSGGGFENVNGRWRYIDPVTGESATGWRNDIPGWENQWIYFDSDGYMQNTPF